MSLIQLVEDDAIVRRSFPRGATVFRERDVATCAYLIESGKVEISTEVGGARKVLTTLGPGEMFGEMAALDGTERSATATAVADTELTLIVHDQLRSRVEAAEPVLRLLLRVILNRFRHERSLFRHPEEALGDGLTPEEETAVSREAIGKIKLESELRGALSKNELTLGYQPIVSLESGRVTGFEALLRWHHPVLGDVPPTRFIGLAEETALIVPIGLWVLERACRDLRRLQRKLGPGITMSVNVSGRQFSEPSFLGELDRVLGASGVDPSAIRLEITEGVLMDYRAEPLGWIDQCKRLGTKIALDDFGTGFSSLSYLTRFAIDTLKIDRSFVTRMCRDDRSRMVTGAIVQLAHTLGLDVVAEGIEEPAERLELRHMGCELGQGFLFARALPIEEALALSPEMR